MRILFLSAYVPSRIRVRPYSFIKALAQRGHHITLLCGSTDADEEALTELRSVCRKIVTVPVGKADMARNALRALPGDMPFQAALSFGPPLLEAVRREVALAEKQGQPFHVAHVEHLRASALGYALRTVPAVLDAVDCISLLFERTLRGSPSPKSRIVALVDLGRTRRYEANYTAEYERVLVTSPEDAWALRELAGKSDSAACAPERIHVVPNGVDLEYFAPQAIEREPATLVFSGKMSYHANIAAAQFLGQEIMPLVWEQRPDVKLVIAGSSPAAEVQHLAADQRITVTGYVPHLRPYLARATIAIAPLRYGVGIQNKVLEAMAIGTPVIAARQAARALSATDGVEFMSGQTAEEYADAVLELLDDSAARQRMGIAARQYVEQYHDWNRLVVALEAIYHQALGMADGLALANGYLTLAEAQRAG